MSNEKTKCQKPDQLKDTPEKCSPEQIRKCHGDQKNHPCAPKPKKKCAKK